MLNEYLCTVMLDRGGIIEEFPYPEPWLADGSTISLAATVPNDGDASVINLRIIFTCAIVFLALFAWCITEIFNSRRKRIQEANENGIYKRLI